MVKKSKCLWGNEFGFTLTEIMTVIFIVAVLVAIAVPSYKNISAKSTQTACEANQRIIEGAISMWLMEDQDHRKADVKLDDLVPFLKNKPIPICPEGNQAYTLNDGEVICPNGHAHY